MTSPVPTTRSKHAKLLQKLDKIGISGNMYNYIRSFLSDRSMQVRWNGATSTTKGVSMGVPQGKWRTLHNWLYKTSKQHVKKKPINTAHIATIEYYILHVIYHANGTQVMSAISDHDCGTIKRHVRETHTRKYRALYKG